MGIGLMIKSMLLAFFASASVTLSGMGGAVSRLPVLTNLVHPDNHGAVVSAVARDWEASVSALFKNHGARVSAVARDKDEDNESSEAAKVTPTPTVTPAQKEKEEEEEENEQKQNHGITVSAVAKGHGWKVRGDAR